MLAIKKMDIKIENNKIQKILENVLKIYIPTNWNLYRRRITFYMHMTY